MEVKSEIFKKKKKLNGQKYFENGLTTSFSRILQSD